MPKTDRPLERLQLLAYLQTQAVNHQVNLSLYQMSVQLLSPSLDARRKKEKPLTKKRSLSRQYLEILLGELEALGYIARIKNSTHKQSITIL